MKRIIGIVLLAVSLALLGCGQGQDQSRNSSSEEADIQPEGIVNAPAPDEPVWAPGTVFNDSTRMETLYIRTAGLNNIFRRALSIHGDDLTGMVSVRMIIESDGSVSQVQLLDDHWSNPYASALTDSMLFNLQLWTFPPGLEKPVAMVQPFKFSK